MSEYEKILVETYRDSSGKMKVRPIAGEIYSTSLNVECGHDVREDHPEGTKFRMQVKLTTKPGNKIEHLYSHYKWQCDVVD